MAIRKIDSAHPDRICSTNCHQARTDKCTCICEGQYHGCALHTNRMPTTEEEAKRLWKGEVLEGHQYGLALSESTDEGKQK